MDEWIKTALGLALEYRDADDGAEVRDAYRALRAHLSSVKSPEPPRRTPEIMAEEALLYAAFDGEGARTAKDVVTAVTTLFGATATEAVLSKYKPPNAI